MSAPRRILPKEDDPAAPPSAQQQPLNPQPSDRRTSPPPEFQAAVRAAIRADRETPFGGVGGTREEAYNRMIAEIGYAPIGPTPTPFQWTGEDEDEDDVEIERRLLQAFEQQEPGLVEAVRQREAAVASAAPMVSMTPFLRPSPDPARAPTSNSAQQIGFGRPAAAPTMPPRGFVPNSSSGNAAAPFAPRLGFRRPGNLVGSVSPAGVPLQSLPPALAVHPRLRSSPRPFNPAPPVAAPAPAPAATTTNTNVVAGTKRKADDLRDGNNTPPAPPRRSWTPPVNVGDIADPFICPGMNHDCFHASRDERAYFDHVGRAHNYTKGQLNKPGNEAVLAIFKPARQLSWYQAQGIDTTYRGDDPKQRAAAIRREQGIRTDSPEYIRHVYGRSYEKHQKQMEEEGGKNGANDEGGADDENGNQ